MENVGDDVTALVVGAEVARERRAQAGATSAAAAAGGGVGTARVLVRLLAHAEELTHHTHTHGDTRLTALCPGPPG